MVKCDDIFSFVSEFYVTGRSAKYLFRLQKDGHVKKWYVLKHQRKISSVRQQCILYVFNWIMTLSLSPKLQREEFQYFVETYANVYVLSRSADHALPVDFVIGKGG